MVLSFSMILIWVSLLLYSGSFIPQIVVNYQIKSARGISDMFIWCYCTGYLLMLLYVFLQPFAYPYRIMVPIETGFMMVLLGQRLYYDGLKKSPGFNLAIIASFVAIFGMLYFVPVHQQLVANIAGWISFMAFAINPVPQLIKIFRTKTTFGFSFWFASLTAAAQVFELVGGVIECVPIPTLAMAVRGLIVYVFYWIFFAKYPAKR